MEEVFDLRLRDKVEVQEISVDTSIEATERRARRRYAIVMVDSDGASVIFSQIPDVMPHSLDQGLSWTDYQRYVEEKLSKLEKVGEVYDEKGNVTFEIYAQDEPR